ncbi:Hypothetical protein PP7435_CHR2-1770 [Komagataella phaffii CBS 7435]|uniref:Uncharacterized protein n=1 Tax=Komagataella phaffii (strain ATCC 76273 / CBS 7435 / CECT 11047 / NRRL Y-11430 / Wegner 21-1) TaxID=981350 RepID=A0A1G4KPR8_KOMPC|nr:Hypothetical protein BQ9382_C2-2058 [Komagataella phaffii CBS 7435]SCV12007.1 Hypothetical protein PP7435_CHR2-1770 [Komagataella phaffii CBS 7435]
MNTIEAIEVWLLENLLLKHKVSVLPELKDLYEIIILKNAIEKYSYNFEGSS